MSKPRIYSDDERIRRKVEISKPELRIVNKSTMTKEELKQHNKENNRRYYEKNRDDILEYQKQYAVDNKERAADYHKIYYNKNRKCLLIKAKEYQQEHKMERQKYIEEYNVTHKDIIDVYAEKRRNDPNRKEQRKQHGLTLDGKYAQYKSAAKSRNKIFNLTKEEFSSFWQQPCEYCGDDIDTIGIDRIDNSIGYEVTNLKSCCQMCNYIKKENTLEYFKEQVIKVINHSTNPITTTHTNNPPCSTFSVYRGGAVKRNIEFSLTKEFVKQLVHTSCHYCGSIERIGIDRVDNNIGYVESNVVPCCKFCNLAKHKHSKEDFLSHINKIYTHLNLGT